MSRLHRICHILCLLLFLFLITEPRTKAKGLPVSMTPSRSLEDVDFSELDKLVTAELKEKLLFKPLGMRQGGLSCNLSRSPPLTVGLVPRFFFLNRRNLA